MGRGLAFAVISALAVGGCARLDLPPEQGTPCASSVVLDGTQGTPATFDLDLGSTDVCMQLDASRNAVRAHLQVTVAGGAAGNPEQTGFKSTLVDLDDVPLREGWDVAVGTRVVHNLEWTLDAGEIRDVVLHVARTGAHAPAQVHVSLFEPYE